MKGRIPFLGISVDCLTMKETIDLIDLSIKNKRSIRHVVINAGKVVSAQKDAALRQSIINCDIINPDGQSIIWASRLLGNALPERVAGIDLMLNLVEMAAKKGYRIFLLGAQKAVVNKVVNVLGEEYGNDLIAGYRDGFFSDNEEVEVVEDIIRSNADMLFVAISSPKKEIFLYKYRNIINVPFTMGVGGSFDVISGIKKRAPIWVQDAGFEWLFRVIQEPKRMWKRYLFGNAQFLYLILKERVKQTFHH